MGIKERFFDNREPLFETLAREVVENLSEAIDLRGRSCLVVSGGGTPKPLFEILARAELDWYLLWAVPLLLMISAIAFGLGICVPLVGVRELFRSFQERRSRR